MLNICDTESFGAFSLRCRFYKFIKIYILVDTLIIISFYQSISRYLFIRRLVLSTANYMNKIDLTGLFPLEYFPWTKLHKHRAALLNMYGLI